MTNVLGINLSTLDKKEAWKKIQDMIEGDKQNYIVTPNPEIILESHRDEEFFYVLNKADLALADGFGVKIAGKLLGEKIPRITGADITLKILSLAEKENRKILVINWNRGLSSEDDLVEALKKKYPSLEVMVENREKNGSWDKETLKRINDFKPKILFCTLGFPYQEKFIYHNLNSIPSVTLALGVGGAFDFITKKARRAPKLMRFLGLEWLWRLIIKPRRIKRIYRATVIFTLRLLQTRFIDPLRYRANVACFLYKKVGKAIQVLVVEREEEQNHWQIPQGGRDGESIIKAGSRELREELNTNKFITRGSFKRVYQYKYIPNENKREHDSDKIRSVKAFKFSYKGQRQGLYIAEFTGQDDDIKVNFWDHSQFKWVDLDNLSNAVHPIRKAATQLFVNKFKSLNIN